MAITKATSNSIAPAAKGDLVVGTATNDSNILAVGTNNYILTADSAEATGLKWAAPAGGSSFVGVKCTSNLSSISIANTTIQTINWNTESFDTDTFHNTSTNTSRITIPAGKAGYYQVIAALHYAANATGQRQIRLSKNGTFTANTIVAANSASGDTAFVFNEIINLAVTDYIEIAAYQSSGGALNITVDNTESFFSVNYLGA